MAREYFCAYHSILDAIEPLNDAERGRLFTACLIYSKTGEVSHLGGNERFLFPALRSQIDRDIDNYDAFREKQSRNGKKGGRPKKNTEAENVKAKKENAFEETQKTQPFLGKPKKANEKEKEKEKEKENIPPPASPLPPPSDERQAAGGGIIQTRPAKAMELCRYFEENCHVFNSRPLLDAITRCLLDGISPEVLYAVIDDTALANAERPAQYAVKIMDSILAEKVRDLSTYRARSEKYRKKMGEKNGKSSGNSGASRRAELPGGEHF